jgi:carbon storage regulator
MLVLSRKQSERIRVGNDIVVTVVRLSGDKVRLGIEAPSDMIVLRDELKNHGGSNLGGGNIGRSAAPASDAVVGDPTVPTNRISQLSS